MHSGQFSYSTKESGSRDAFNIFMSEARLSGVRASLAIRPIIFVLRIAKKSIQGVLALSENRKWPNAHFFIGLKTTKHGLLTIV